jgi:predicted small lipoprotein YifL
MLRVPQILVSPLLQRLACAALAAGLLAACGQKGDLYMPGGPAATNRATLPETLAPSTSVRTPAAPASAPPVTGTASPVRQP